MELGDGTEIGFVMESKNKRMASLPVLFRTSERKMSNIYVTLFYARYEQVNV